MPTLSAMLTSFAAKLTDMENYETDDGMYQSLPDNAISNTIQLMSPR